MRCDVGFGAFARSLCTLLAGAAVAAPLPAHSTNTGGAAKAGAPSPYRQQQKMGGKAKEYYAAAWGVDALKVNYTSSGNLIRFSYRVSDPERARPLGDKKATPSLFSPKSHAVLQVPVMDKVGMLRQSGLPRAGQEYWMVFSNKGNVVKPGDRVNVAIGAFRAEGLLVE
jgi:hypothetical protein